MIKKIAIFSQENNPDSERLAPIDERSINPEQLKVIEKIGLDKIRDFARNKNLIENRDLLSILYRWRDFTGGSYKEPKRFLRGKLDTANNLINVVKCFITEGQSIGGDDYVAQKTKSVNLNNVRDFLDLDSLMPEIRHLIHVDCLTKEEATDIQIFIDTYDGKVDRF
jgi:predicted KAP-like P-loop ATPase